MVCSQFMRAIFEPRIKVDNNKFLVTCECGKETSFNTKQSAIKLLNRGNCRYCARHYRSVKDKDVGIYQREDGKWCSNCSGCGCEQAYTRKDHAKQSSASDWQCKKCVAESKGFSNNKPVGDKTRIYNKFKKSAYSRGIEWQINEEQMFSSFNGHCAMTNWPISIAYSEPTASLDRINSSIGYFQNNIQWVHSMVNMCKNKYNEGEFIKMCIAIASKHSPEKSKDCVDKSTTCEVI